jgi:tyrosine-specific transport protein
MLALPEVAREPGFIPSTLTLVGCWVFMSITGLLIAEVAANLRVRGVEFESLRREDGDRVGDGDADLALKPKGILAMVDGTLGRPAALASGATYLFFHYTLLCAYISEAGLILDESLFHSPDSKFGSLVFTAVLGYILFFGSENFIGKFNDVSLLVVILSFLGLVCILSNLFSSDQLLTVYEFVYIPKAVPIMFLALIYHNVVPVICEKLKYDKKSITKAILFGTFIPLFMFVLWIGLILGIKLPEGDGSNLDVMTKVDPVMLLKMKNPGNEFLGPLVSLFSEFSISTSFTGFVLGLTSFFKDIFPNRQEDASPDPYVYSLILLPPLVVSLLGGSDSLLGG